MFIAPHHGLGVHGEPPRSKGTHWSVVKWKTDVVLVFCTEESPAGWCIDYQLHPQFCELVEEELIDPPKTEQDNGGTRYSIWQHVGHSPLHSISTWNHWWNVTKYIYSSSTCTLLEYFHCLLFYTSSIKSEENIVLFTPLHLLDSFVYFADSDD